MNPWDKHFDENGQPIYGRWPFNWCWRCDRSIGKYNSYPPCAGHEEPYDTEKRWSWVYRSPDYGIETNTDRPTTEWFARYCFVSLGIRWRQPYRGAGVLLCDGKVIESFGGGLLYDEETRKWKRP